MTSSTEALRADWYLLQSLASLEWLEHDGRPNPIALEMLAQARATARREGMEAAAKAGPRYRHKARGTEYTLIGVGRAQGTLHDEDPVVLYRGDDGGLWVRHQVEFSDGRFEELPAIRANMETGK